MATAYCEIPLTRGYRALVDVDDYGRVVAEGRWHAVPNGNTVYARRTVNRQNFYLHNFLAEATHTDHDNRDGLDNRQRNLRPSATKSQNGGNMGLRTSNKTGFKGVYYSSTKRCYVARVQVAGKSFKKHRHTAEEAARAYDEMALTHFGEFALTNRQMGLIT